MANNRALRVLLFGWTNLNVIDGSAFFISSLAETLSNSPLIDVSIALAKPLRRTLVLDDILGRDNVMLLDPFERELLGNAPSSIYGAESMTFDQAAQALKDFDDENTFDVIIVRSSEVASRLSAIAPAATSRLIAYLSGITSWDQDPSAETLKSVRELQDSNALLAVQTPEMKERLLSIVSDEFDPVRAVVVSPMVPSEKSNFEDAFAAKSHYTKFVYTGKFFEEWYPDRIFAGFKQARQVTNTITLDVAGDQFRRSPSNPLFIPNTKYLLENTAGIVWHGGLTRRSSRELIERSDIGISWRAPALDTSLELSTKVLEYGVLGKPSIVNRTDMHERLFGSDYPLFANSMPEFVRKLLQIQDEPEIVEFAARRCFDASLNYGYLASLSRLLDIFRLLRNSPCDLLPKGARFTTDVTVTHEALPSLISIMSSARIRNISGIGPSLRLQTEAVSDKGWPVLEANLAGPLGVELAGLISAAVSTKARKPSNKNLAPQKSVSATPSLSGESEAMKIRQLREALEKNDRVRLAAEQDYKNRIGLLSVELAHANERLVAFRNSKLGSIQYKIWKRRARKSK